jgi:hypothetical protein
MAFRRKGTETVRALPCWCGAEVIITRGLDTDGNPYEYTSCTTDVFHDVGEEDT